MRNRITFILSALLLAACGGGAQMTPASAPPEIRSGESMMVFMRASALGGLVAASVFDVTTPETKFVGIVNYGTKLAHPVKPGEYTFMVIGESADFMRATVLPDRTYYVLVTPRVGVWKARFSFRPVRNFELDGSEFAGWTAATPQYVTNSAASLNWAVENAADIQSKRTQYWPDWLSKPAEQQASQTLAAADGRPMARSQASAAPVAATAIATPVVAAAAPTAQGAQNASNTRIPQVGDTWTYRLNEPKRADGPKQRDYVVKVAEVSLFSIKDQIVIGDAPSGEVTHKGERLVLPLEKSLFSPYLLVFSDSATGAGNLGRLAIDDPACGGTYVCEATGRVVAWEKVVVPAGTFDAVKVEVQQSWRPTVINGQFGAQMVGARTVTVWYAKDTKRAIKYTSRGSFGRMPPMDTDFDLELVNYKLN